MAASSSTPPIPALLHPAKDLLDKRGIAFEEINLASDPAGRAELVEKTGNFTFPRSSSAGPRRRLHQLKADQSGQLDELLAQAA